MRFLNGSILFSLLPFVLLSLLIFSFGWMQCASERAAVKTATPSPTVMDSSEAKIDILSLLKDDITIPPKVRKIETSPIDTTLPAALFQVKQDTTVPQEDEMTMGYRIEIFRSDSFPAATSMQEKALLEFTESGVYLDYDAPYYKVRVGDCTNRVDAEGLLKRVQQMGYPEAFLINSRVYAYPELRRPNLLGTDTVSSDQDTLDTEAPPSP